MCVCVCISPSVYGGEGGRRRGKRGGGGGGVGGPGQAAGPALPTSLPESASRATAENGTAAAAHVLHTRAHLWL